MLLNVLQCKEQLHTENNDLAQNNAMVKKKKKICSKLFLVLTMVEETTSGKEFWPFWVRLIFTVYIWTEVVEKDKVRGFGGCEVENVFGVSCFPENRT